MGCQLSLSIQENPALFQVIVYIQANTSFTKVLILFSKPYCLFLHVCNLPGRPQVSAAAIYHFLFSELPHNKKAYNGEPEDCQVS